MKIFAKPCSQWKESQFEVIFLLISYTLQYAPIAMNIKVGEITCHRSTRLKEQYQKEEGSGSVPGPLASADTGLQLYL